MYFKFAENNQSYSETDINQDQLQYADRTASQNSNKTQSQSDAIRLDSPNETASQSPIQQSLSPNGNNISDQRVESPFSTQPNPNLPRPLSPVKVTQEYNKQSDAQPSPNAEWEDQLRQQKQLQLLREQQLMQEQKLQQQQLQQQQHLKQQQMLKQQRQQQHEQQQQRQREQQEQDEWQQQLELKKIQQQKDFEQQQKLKQQQLQQQQRELQLEQQFKQQQQELKQRQLQLEQQQRLQQELQQQQQRVLSPPLNNVIRFKIECLKSKIIIIYLQKPNLGTLYIPPVTLTNQQQLLNLETPTWMAKRNNDKDLPEWVNREENMLSPVQNLNAGPKVN